MKTEMTVPADNEPTMEVIRSETALRFPIHLLNKKGKGNIVISIKSKNDGEELRWEVRTPPGPLSYKIDTIVINRKIDEYGWDNIPQVICLGSLRDICKMLGVAPSGQNIANIRSALHDGGRAWIISKFRYQLKGKGKDGKPLFRSCEEGFNRYRPIFIGEDLPSGAKADAVYIQITDEYRKILETCVTRPLDYDYLRSLSPGAQRFYEILSFRMYAALRAKRGEASITYSEYCLLSAQKRHVNSRQAIAQMRKLCKPHNEAKYVEGFRFTPLVDREGKPDWELMYQIGEKAKAEFSVFTRTKAFLTSPQLIADKPSADHPDVICQNLIEIGVSPRKAAELAMLYPDRCVVWVEAVKNGVVSSQIENIAGYVVKAVLDNFTFPKSPSDLRTRKKEEQGSATYTQQHLLPEEQQREAETDIYSKYLEYFDGLSIPDQEELEEHAINKTPKIGQIYLDMKEQGEDKEDRARAMLAALLKRYLENQKI